MFFVSTEGNASLRDTSKYKQGQFCVSCLKNDRILAFQIQNAVRATITRNFQNWIWQDSSSTHHSSQVGRNFEKI